MIANLNLSNSIQLLTIRLISSGELPSPALAMIASLMGYTKNIVSIIPNAIVSTVISK